MCFQRAPNNVSPFETFTCRPKCNNETGSFKHHVCEAACEAQKMMDSYALTIFATEDASLESLDTVASSAYFWRVDTNYNTETDAKHNVKNDLHHELGVNYFMVAGYYVIDGN